MYDIEGHWFSRLDALMFPGHNYIGSEHLLLGLLREGEGVAARVLESLGADPSNIRTQVNDVHISEFFLLSVRVVFVFL